MFMKSVNKLIVVLSVSGAFLACDNPVEQNSDPELTLSPDTVIVGVSESYPVTATVRDAGGAVQNVSVQYVSRNQSVATVNPNGGITGVGAGSTFIVAFVSDRANVRDSVAVRVQAQPPIDPVATADSAFVAALRTYLQSATAAEQFSGAVLITRDGRTLFEGAYGFADREKGVPNTPLTQFRVGSMNKMMTAVAALQLVQAGTLKLDVPLGTYLTDYPNQEVASKVTPHHLLTHSGGTGDIFGSEFMTHRLELRTISDYLELFGARGLQFTPGGQFAYSNYGYILLGALIERLSGTSYYDQVATRVLGPAGMTASNFAPEDSIVPGRAVGYTRQLVPGQLVSNAPTLPYRGTSAGGGYSTVGDFVRFADAIREHRLLDAAHTELLINAKIQSNQGMPYGYGFFNRFVDGRRFVGHTGGAAGMSGVLEFEPSGGYSIVVLSNFDSPTVLPVLAFIYDNLPAAPSSFEQF